MATIVTTFQLNENMTEGFKKMAQSAEETSNRIAKLEEKLENAGKKANDFGMKALKLSGIVTVAKSVADAFGKVSASIQGCVDAYAFQTEQETKLGAVMRQRMGATQEDIDMIKQVAAEQQKLGIYGDEMILRGAQELATYVDSKEALAELIPVMGHMVAQQVGMNATAENFQSVATMIGKVAGGQLGGLSRVGYVFSDAEKAALETGTELERMQVLSGIIKNNIGEMSYALRGTAKGSIMDMNNMIGDMQEQLGKALEPIAMTMKKLKATITMSVLPPLIKIANWISKNLPRIAIITIGTLAAILAMVIVVQRGHMIAMAKMAVQWIVGLGPVAWIVAGIIAALAALIAIVHKVLGSFEAMFSEIGKGFGAAYAVIRNIIAAIWNTLLVIAEPIANVFADIVMRIQRFLSPIIDVLKAVLTPIVNVIQETIGVVKDTVNKIIGWLMDKIVSLEPLLVHLGEFGKNMIESAKGWTADSLAKIPKTFDLSKYKMQTVGIGDTMETFGDKFGGVGAKIDNLFPKDADGNIMLNGAANGDEFSFDSNGNLKVKQQGAIEISDEYKRLLADKATQQYLMKFDQHTVKPEVKIGNVTINSGADADYFIDELGEGIVQAYESDLRRSA